MIWFLYQLSSDAQLQTKRIAGRVICRWCTRLPYLDVRDTFISVDSAPDGWFCSKSASASVTTNATGSVISLRPQWVLPCLSVLIILSNIGPNIFQFIHPLSRTLQFHCNVRLLSWYVICLSTIVCLWRECIVTRWLKLGSRGFHIKVA